MDTLRFTAKGSSLAFRARLTALFIAKWKLDPTKTKALLTPLTLLRRRFVIQNFKVSEGLSPIDELMPSHDMWTTTLTTNMTRRRGDRHRFRHHREPVRVEYPTCHFTSSNNNILLQLPTPTCTRDLTRRRLDAHAYSRRDTYVDQNPRTRTRTHTRTRSECAFQTVCACVCACMSVGFSLK